MMNEALIKVLKGQALKAGTKVVSFFSDDKGNYQSRILGSILVTIAGLSLYLDKFLFQIEFESTTTFGFTNFGNFIWVLTQSLAPLLMLLGFYLKAFKISFLIPIYCYALQIIWTFSPQYSDKFLGYIFATGICVIFIFLVYILKKTSQYFGRKKSQDEQFIANAKEVLSILKEKVINGNLEA